MSSQTAVKAAQAAQSLPRVIAVNKKYTVQSTGIWERIRRTFAVDPTRSNGVPLNPQFRNPPPGSNEPFSFIDPVTIPAGDIADNPYWKRDSRRSYALASVVSQSDVVGLLSVGSKAAPKKELIGEEGSKMLVAVEEEAKGGLAKFFEKEKGVGLLGENGLPPLPSGQNWGVKTAGDKYEMTEEQSYPKEYPCRTFA
ncbi:putative NADH-ubiquinone oxidoreductase subunit [Coleophoma cylindrospora]|uniref:Putative NADH-ubiquinone oxidoreductase subunit n=1 Tax=Coleophoma cylindrospora TaxID=1849047 RepID=A0A3D8QGE9_9HELO|nr:putative NADH-ubiquinone oxidoreductase subunit [Coleophoma cylindrospora]